MHAVVLIKIRVFFAELRNVPRTACHFLAKGAHGVVVVRDLPPCGAALERGFKGGDDGADIDRGVRKVLLEQGKCVVDFVYIILWRWPVPDADVIDAIGQENDRRIQRDKLLQVVNDLLMVAPESANTRSGAR